MRKLLFILMAFSLCSTLQARENKNSILVQYGDSIKEFSIPTNVDVFQRKITSLCDSLLWDNNAIGLVIIKQDTIGFLSREPLLEWENIFWVHTSNSIEDYIQKSDIKGLMKFVGLTYEKSHDLFSSIDTTTWCSHTQPITFNNHPRVEIMHWFGLREIIPLKSTNTMEVSKILEKCVIHDFSEILFIR